MCFIYIFLIENVKINKKYDKIFVNYIVNKRLKFEIYKELINLIV